MQEGLENPSGKPLCLIRIIRINKKEGRRSSHHIKYLKTTKENFPAHKVSKAHQLSAVSNAVAGAEETHSQTLLSPCAGHTSPATGPACSLQLGFDTGVWCIPAWQLQPFCLRDRCTRNKHRGPATRTFFWLKTSSLEGLQSWFQPWLWISLIPSTWGDLLRCETWMLAGVHELHGRVRRHLWFLKDLGESISIPSLTKNQGIFLSCRNAGERMLVKITKCSVWSSKNHKSIFKRLRCDLPLALWLGPCTTCCLIKGSLLGLNFPAWPLICTLMWMEWHGGG